MNAFAAGLCLGLVVALLSERGPKPLIAAIAFIGVVNAIAWWAA